MSTVVVGSVCSCHRYGGWGILCPQLLWVGFVVATDMVGGVYCVHSCCGFGL